MKIGNVSNIHDVNPTRGSSGGTCTLRYNWELAILCRHGNQRNSEDFGYSMSRENQKKNVETRLQHLQQFFLGYVWVEIEIVVIMRLRLPRFILWFPSFSQLSTSQTLWPRHLGHSQDVAYGGSGEIGDHSPMPWLTQCYACAPGPRRWKDVQIAADSSRWSMLRFSWKKNAWKRKKTTWRRRK